MSGSLTLGDVGSRAVDVGSGYEEDRDGSGHGAIELSLPYRDLVGTASVRFSLSSAPSGRGAARAVHAWGAVSAVFGTELCRGTFAFSWFPHPTEGGGAVQLTCDDGAAFSAALTVERLDDAVGLHLDDGWYVASAARG